MPVLLAGDFGKLFSHWSDETCLNMFRTGSKHDVLFAQTHAGRQCFIILLYKDSCLSVGDSLVSLFVFPIYQIEQAVAKKAWLIQSRCGVLGCFKND